MFCRNSSGMLRWLASSMKCAPLSALSLNRMPLLARMPTGKPWMWAKPQTSVCAVERLELVELGAVDDARDHVAHVVGRARIGRHDAVQLVGRIAAARAACAAPDMTRFTRLRLATMRARDAERMAVVGGVVVGHAGLPAVHVGAAEIFGAHLLAGRRLHQRRPAEEDGALIAHDDALVRHRRHIGAAGGAGAHHDRDLRDAQRRHARLVVEDAAEMALVRERSRPAAAGTRRRNRPGRRRAGGSRARSPGRADASSPSSDSRCRP